MILTLISTAPDGSTLYLRDDPDGCRSRATPDPFLARPFPDARAVADYLAAHPELDPRRVAVVPWPIDLDVSCRPDPPDAPPDPPAPPATARPRDRRAAHRGPRTEELFR